jgi:hypothetical protein
MPDHTSSSFVAHMGEFIDSLSGRFPENAGIQSAKGGLDGLKAMGGGMTFMDDMMCKKWYDISQPIVNEIHGHNAEVVGKAFDTCDVAMIANIGAGAILVDQEVDDETKQSIWGHIIRLTTVSFAVNVVVHSMATPAVTPKPTPAPAPGKPDIKSVIKGLTSSLPDIIEGLNEALRSNGMEGENPVMDMVKQMMNPGALNSGMAPNLAALATGAGQEGSAMADAASSLGVSVEEMKAKFANHKGSNGKRSGRRN